MYIINPKTPLFLKPRPRPDILHPKALYGFRV